MGPSQEVQSSSKGRGEAEAAERQYGLEEMPGRDSGGAFRVEIAVKLGCKTGRGSAARVEHAQVT